jgi:hypothetical protein
MQLWLTAFMVAVIALSVNEHTRMPLGRCLPPST